MFRHWCEDPPQWGYRQRRGKLLRVAAVWLIVEIFKRNPQGQKGGREGQKKSGEIERGGVRREEKKKSGEFEERGRGGSGEIEERERRNQESLKEGGGGGCLCRDGLRKPGASRLQVADGPHGRHIS